VYVIFDEPVTLSMMRVWNYSKTPPRGVRDIAVCIFCLLSVCYNSLAVVSSVLPALITEASALKGEVLEPQ